MDISNDDKLSIPIPISIPIAYRGKSAEVLEHVDVVVYR